jgi:tripartite-type tricarboxylate transporter receptor subunit TctC
LSVRKDLKEVKDLDAFLNHARVSNGQLSYWTPGFGSDTYLLMEHFKKTAGFTAIHIDGIYDATQANEKLAAGQLHFGFSPAVTSKVRSGSLRAIAISGAESVDAFPAAVPIERCQDATAGAPSAVLPKDQKKKGTSMQGAAPKHSVPTNESTGDSSKGCVHGWNPLESYHFISVPKNTPYTVRQRIAAAIKEALVDPKVQRALRDTGFEPGYRAASDLKIQLKADEKKVDLLLPKPPT